MYAQQQAYCGMVRHSIAFNAADRGKTCLQLIGLCSVSLVLGREEDQILDASKLSGTVLLGISIRKASVVEAAADLCGCICMQVIIVSDELNCGVPDVFGGKLSSTLNERDHDVSVPL